MDPFDLFNLSKPCPQFTCLLHFVWKRSGKGQQQRSLFLLVLSHSLTLFTSSTKNDGVRKCSRFKHPFISWKSYVLFLRYSILYILNQSTNLKSYDVMMSISLGYIFIVNYLVMKHGQLISRM